MNDLPTHRHKKSGDIVFWEKGMDRADYTRLPKNYWPDLYKEEGGKARILEVKAEAQRRILKSWPIHRQLNVIASGDLAAIKAMVAKIDAVRAWSKAEQAKVGERPK